MAVVACRSRPGLEGLLNGEEKSHKAKYIHIYRERERERKRERFVDFFYSPFENSSRPLLKVPMIGAKSVDLLRLLSELPLVLAARLKIRDSAADMVCSSRKTTTSLVRKMS